MSTKPVRSTPVNRQAQTAVKAQMEVSTVNEYENKLNKLANDLSKSYSEYEAIVAAQNKIIADANAVIALFKNEMNKARELAARIGVSLN